MQLQRAKLQEYSTEEGGFAFSDSMYLSIQQGLMCGNLVSSPVLPALDCGVQACKYILPHHCLGCGCICIALSLALQHFLTQIAHKADK